MRERIACNVRMAWVKGHFPFLSTNRDNDDNDKHNYHMMIINHSSDDHTNEDDIRNIMMTMLKMHQIPIVIN